MIQIWSCSGLLQCLIEVCLRRSCIRGDLSETYNRKSMCQIRLEQTNRHGRNPTQVEDIFVLAIRSLNSHDISPNRASNHNTTFQHAVLITFAVTGYIECLVMLTISQPY